MVSPKNRRYLSRIMFFAMAWVLFSIIYALIERGILGDYHQYPSTGNPYDFNLIVNFVAAAFSGLLVGSVEVLYLNKLFKKSSFFYKVFFKTAIYLLIITLVLIINTLIGNAFEMDTHLLDSRVWNDALIFLNSFAFWSIAFYVAIMLIICLFFLEVSDFIGQEVLFNFFIGKYHHPIEEERIFMFLDMKSSTTIAEKLGHVRYFKMLKEYYSDLSPPIITYAGEIYQYVGDEIIVSWSLKKGMTRSNCLHCFFAMKEALQRQDKKYQAEFGLVPTFKAGLHFGKVTTGEIGAIKKEITFSGDVLNTTARIQGLCNDFEVDIIVSAPLMSTLQPGTEFLSKELGEAKLRGRTEKMDLFTIEKSA